MEECQNIPQYGQNIAKALSEDQATKCLQFLTKIKIVHI